MKFGMDVTELVVVSNDGSSSKADPTKTSQVYTDNTLAIWQVFDRLFKDNQKLEKHTLSDDGRTVGMLRLGVSKKS
jgi:hypothetical protein